MPFLVMGWYMTRLPKGWPALLLIPGSLLALRAPVFDLHYLYVHPVHYLNAFLCCAGLHRPGEGTAGKPRVILAWPEFFSHYVYTRHLFGGILCVTGNVFCKKMDANVPACV